MPRETAGFIDFLRNHCALDEDTAHSILEEAHDFKEASAQIALRFGLLSPAQLDQVLSAGKAEAEFEQTVSELGIWNEQDLELLGQANRLQRAVEVCIGLILAEKMSLQSAATYLHEYFRATEVARSRKQVEGVEE